MTSTSVSPLLSSTSSPTILTLQALPSNRFSLFPEKRQTYGYQRSLHNASTMLAFANYRASPTAPDIVLPCSESDTNSAVRTVQRSPLHDGLFQKASRISTALRYGRFVACFNLYPATTHDLAVNDLLWRVAHDGEYDPQIGNHLLQYNVMALAFPTAFYAFLSSVSKQHLDRCVLQVLALIAEGEDAEGLNLMKHELEPTLWQKLEHYMQQTQTENRNSSELNESLESADQSYRQLMIDVEMLLRFCYRSPWKIEVFASFVTPRDMALILPDLELNSKSMRNGPTVNPILSGISSTNVLTDRPLVRSSARRPVWGVGNIRNTPSSSPIFPSNSVLSHKQHTLAERLSNKKLAFWTQFLHWRIYRRVLVQNCDIHPSVVAEALLSAIEDGSVDDALRRALTVMCCACVQGNLLSSLPKEVVFRYIAPYVLLAG